MEINLPKLPKLTLSRLQALLLLGGAFVFFGLFWLSGHRLVSDTTAAVPQEAVVALGLRLPVYDRYWRSFVDAMPEDAQATFARLLFEPDAAVYAVIDDQERLEWRIAWASGKRVWRWVPRDARGFGFVRIGSHKLPFTAYFEQDTSRVVVGRAYRGVTLQPPLIDKGRKMLFSMKEQSVYIEKPSGVSWAEPIDALRSQMQRFESLLDPLSLPGRVELATSASTTGSALMPFLLYYRPPAGQTIPREKVYMFAKKLLSEAEPESFQVRLPDGSLMTEFRYDTESVKATTQQSRFGDIVRFSKPNGRQHLVAYHDDLNESWLSSDIELIQSSLLGNIGSKPSKSACGKSGVGGYIDISGALLPFPSAFSHVSFSLENLETGLFTICGYY